MEVVRDKKDNCIIVCSIENLDPMGVHTGDSITVAPAQTLTDKEYQIMRDASLAVLREIGVDTGGSNVQFAINPDDGRMIVIEMNPRVSRSSALASKATGFPIAKVAAKLAVGYTLDELKNEITGGADAGLVRADDRLRRHQDSALRLREISAGRSDRLTTQMKSVGEVMAIGRTFQESLQKALRGLEIGVDGLDAKDHGAATRSSAKSANAGPDRIWYVGDAFRHRHDAAEIFAETAHRSVVPRADRADHPEANRRWSGRTLASLYRGQTAVPQAQAASRTAAWRRLLGAKRGRSARSAAIALNVRPVYKRVDTCAAEFATNTAYMYSTYEEECEAHPTEQQENHGAGRRPEPHRPGHRVRLLLRARRARAARRRLRNDHGQLQPGDRFDRLRHLRPAVLRAADARRRARNRRQGEAGTA